MSLKIQSTAGSKSPRINSVWGEGPNVSFTQPFVLLLCSWAWTTEAESGC